jgi:hypothetical protein
VSSGAGSAAPTSTIDGLAPRAAARSSSPHRLQLAGVRSRAHLRRHVLLHAHGCCCLGVFQYLTHDLPGWRRRAWSRRRRGLRLPSGEALRGPAFASGGSAVTGVEPSQGCRPTGPVAQRPPTLVIGCGLAWILGLSASPPSRCAPSGAPCLPDRRGRGQAARSARSSPLRAGCSSRAGGQHRLRRLPAAGQPAGGRQLPASPAHQAGAPAGVLQRHHRPGCGGGSAGGHQQRCGHPADPRLRHFGVHRLHHVAGGHDQAPPAQAQPWRRHRHQDGGRLSGVVLVVIATRVPDGALGDPHVLPLA